MHKKPKSLEPNKLPLWQSVTKHNLNNSKFTSRSPLQNNAQKHKFNPNYYPSVARVDNNLINQPVYFLKHLNKMHNRMCGKKYK